MDDAVRGHLWLPWGLASARREEGEDSPVQTSTAAALPAVAFIGTGGIGAPMVERLARSGILLTACDLRAEALAPLHAQGVRITQRVADCADAQVVIVMVATDAQVRSVVLGDNGLLRHVDRARPPLLIVMSSVLPATVREVAMAGAAAGVRVLDAPVSGGRVSAAQGTLTILAGGAPDDLAAARPVLELLGSRIVHCGAPGSGAAVKIVNNILGVANMFLMTEASRLAQELGLDPDWVAGVMEQSSGRNLGTRDPAAHRQLYRLNTASPQSLKALLDVCRKDLALAQALAHEHGLGLPMLEAVKQALDATPDTSIGAHWRRLAGEG
jgi:3-hydroxyisobutyrate dehydrogenase-like beta-hydroxyacid dehydrogenase